MVEITFWLLLKTCKEQEYSKTNILKYLRHRLRVIHHSTNSRISPGWQFNTLQIASRVLKRTAFALPVFSTERLDNVISTFSESSFNDIFLLAIITSKFTIIGIVYTVNSFSV